MNYNFTIGAVLAKCHENYAGCIRKKMRHSKGTEKMAKGVRQKKEEINNRKFKARVLQKKTHVTQLSPQLL